MSEFEKWFKSKNFPKPSDWHSGAREGWLEALKWIMNNPHTRMQTVDQKGINGVWENVLNGDALVDIDEINNEIKELENDA